MPVAVAQVHSVLRGWVNYFRVGNPGRAFDKVKYEVERKVRRLDHSPNLRINQAFTNWVRTT
jgi:hypothetical protein